MDQSEKFFPSVGLREVHLIPYKIKFPDLNADLKNEMRWILKASLSPIYLFAE